MSLLGHACEHSITALVHNHLHRSRLCTAITEEQSAAMVFILEIWSQQWHNFFSYVRFGVCFFFLWLKSKVHKCCLAGK